MTDGGPAAPSPPRPQGRGDVHSYAEPDRARVRHLALELRVDFDARRLAGRATLDLDVAPGADAVVLDARGLRIRAATDGAGRSFGWTLGPEHPVFGSALRVELPPGVARVAVDYETGPGADALQWLAPEQTEGGAHPFLFTQGHAILARSWLPTQDSPGVRQTYEARVTVPAPLSAVMSAEQLTPDPDAARGAGSPGSGMRRFDFRMPQPIPPYLIALAVGDLAFRPLGPRSGVYAEPAVVGRAADEFAEVERMLDAGQSIGGPYRWDRFDVLVPPPSFPFGGMENPRLTFVTPTLLAGDRSLTTLVAHELAHAWAGNLVTHATWSDFWLNEGFTVYMELRINEALYGRERAEMLEVYGRWALEAEVERLGASSPDTRLHVDLLGRDPVEGTTVIPYIKGAAFLRVVEHAVGRERFDAWLRDWFDGHAFRAVTTAELVAHLRAHLVAGDAALETRIGIDEWVYGTGVPANAVWPASAALARVDVAAATFAADGTLPVDAARAWTPQEWRHFLNGVPRPLDASRLAALDGAFSLSAATNAEVLFAWLRLALRSDYDPALATAERFLAAQGRRKYVAPLYEALLARDWGRDRARALYARLRPRYHATVTSALDPLFAAPRAG